MAWRNGVLDISFPGGETPLEALERVKLGIEKIMRNNHEKQIILCLHQRILRIVMCYLLDKPLTDMDHYPHHNTGVTTMDFDANTGCYTLIDLDNFNHLNSLLY